MKGFGLTVFPPVSCQQLPEQLLLLTRTGLHWRRAGELDEWEAELPFTTEQQTLFLTKYWQKRPLLVRGAAPSVVVRPPPPSLSSVTPAGLAGFGCTHRLAGLEAELTLMYTVMGGNTGLENSQLRAPSPDQTVSRGSKC